MIERVGGGCATNANHIVHDEPTTELSPSYIINKINARLSIKGMQRSTLQFKLSMEDEPTEFLETFYGVGYVFQTILDCGDAIREHFLKHGKLIVGIAENKESCWLAYCGWYIIADGMHMIRMVKINQSDFEAAEDVSAQDLYDRHFRFQEHAHETNAKGQMS